KGTKTLDWQEITLAFNKIGAELNAFTSHEATVYYAPFLANCLDRAVELLSDMMYPRLAESDFETEKEVIVNEIARSEDQPYNSTYRRMMQTYFGSHPLGHDVLGSPESIRNMRIEQVRDYWKRRYAANNMILSVAANFDWDHTISLAEQHCNTCQKGLAESASARIWAMEGTGILLMQANSTPEEAPRVLKLLRAELDSFLNDGVYEDEVRRAKDKWISSIVLSSESTFSRMFS